MRKYKKLDKDGKEVAGSGQDMPHSGGNRYQQETPTFESLVTKGGQGTRGDKTFKIDKEYERNKPLEDVNKKNKWKGTM